jgi:hypothetical protein
MEVSAMNSVVVAAATATIISEGIALWHLAVMPKQQKSKA